MRSRRQDHVVLEPATSRGRAGSCASHAGRRPNRLEARPATAWRVAGGEDFRPRGAVIVMTATAALGRGDGDEEGALDSPPNGRSRSPAVDVARAMAQRGWRPSKWSSRRTRRAPRRAAHHRRDAHCGRFATAAPRRSTDAQCCSKGRARHGNELFAARCTRSARAPMVVCGDQLRRDSGDAARDRALGHERVRSRRQRPPARAVRAALGHPVPRRDRRPAVALQAKICVPWKEAVRRSRWHAVAARDVAWSRRTNRNLKTRVADACTGGSLLPPLGVSDQIPPCVSGATTSDPGAPFRRQVLPRAQQAGDAVARDYDELAAIRGRQRARAAELHRARRDPCDGDTSMRVTEPLVQAADRRCSRGSSSISPERGERSAGRRGVERRKIEQDSATRRQPPAGRRLLRSTTSRCWRKPRSSASPTDRSDARSAITPRVASPPEVGQQTSRPEAGDAVRFALERRRAPRAPGAPAGCRRR